jgi:hypothetical protein
LEALEKSPKGKLQPLVKAKNIFSVTPMVLVNDETVEEVSAEEETIRQIEVSKKGETLNCSDSLMMIPNDEDLFNVSDTLLKEVDE